MKAFAPETASLFHTTCRKDRKRNQGNGGNGKKRTSDIPILCPSCNSPFTDVENFEGLSLNCKECVFVIDIFPTYMSYHNSNSMFMEIQKDVKM